MFSPVFEKTLVRAGEVRSYQIQMGSNGWEVSQQDNQKVAHRHYADWHRVERTLEQFEHEIATLRSEGWLESQAVNPHFPDAGPARPDSAAGQRL